jgi:hypothetical protein
MAVAGVIGVVMKMFILVKAAVVKSKAVLLLNTMASQLSIIQG